MMARIDTCRPAVRRAFGAAVMFLLPSLSPAQPAPTPNPSDHQRGPDDIYRREPIGPGLSVLYGGGGNIAILEGPDSLVVVDSQVRELAPWIVRQIQKISEKSIRYLINTHHHDDHTGGNSAFRPLSVIVAHENVRKHMLAEPQLILREYPALLEQAKKSGHAEEAASLDEAIAWAGKVRIEDIAAPVLTFDSEVRIHVGEETIEVWHTPPAHTDGDCVIYFRKANVLHMGDLFANRVIPYVDVEAGGSARGYLVAIDRVLARVPHDVKIIPGHGEASDFAGLQAFRRYVADLVDAVRRAKAAGQSRAQFLATAELAAYRDYSGYADRFRQNCAAAWDEAVSP